MNVLSLFDGMGCGLVALKRLGMEVTSYNASEIDKWAIQIAKKNHSEINHLGDVVNWRYWDLNFSSIDLVLAGSPCQGFSFAGKQLAFDDPRSKLFFVFLDILNHIKKLNPKVKFLLENVRMKKEYLAVITNKLGVEPILINSAMVSAQNRQRYYWCNWENDQPKDKKILLRHIVHEKSDSALYDNDLQFNVNPSGRGQNGLVQPVSKKKSNALTTNKGEGQKVAVDITKYIVPFKKTLQILDKEVERGKVGYFKQDSQANRVYYIHNKAVCLCGDAGGGAAKMGQYLFGHIQTPRGKNDGGLKQRQKSPTLTSNSWQHNNKLLFGCITPDRVTKRQNGQRFSEGRKFYTLTAQDRHGILIEGYIRKLTPIECERLQTLPDNYTQGVSDSQRYKMLGNGWTVDVVCHLLKSMRCNVTTSPIVPTILEGVGQLNFNF